MSSSHSEPRALSPNQARSINFPTHDYKFPEGEGSFTGTLALKMWNGKNCLICYFDTTTGEKLKICVWFSYDPCKTYRPRRSSVDISLVPFGSVLKVEYDQVPNGRSTRWLDVEIISTPGDKNEG